MSRGQFSLIDFWHFRVGLGTELRIQNTQVEMGQVGGLEGVTEEQLMCDFTSLLKTLQRVFLDLFLDSIPSTTSYSRSVTLRRNSRFASQIKPSANGVSR